MAWVCLPMLKSYLHLQCRHIQRHTPRCSPCVCTPSLGHGAPEPSWFDPSLAKEFLNHRYFILKLHQRVTNLWKITNSPEYNLWSMISSLLWVLGLTSIHRLSSHSSLLSPPALFFCHVAMDSLLLRKAASFWKGLCPSSYTCASAGDITGFSLPLCPRGQSHSKSMALPIERPLFQKARVFNVDGFWLACDSLSDPTWLVGIKPLSQNRCSNPQCRLHYNMRVTV